MGMPSPITGFKWVFGMTTLFGLLVGTLNLLNPEAVHIPFGDQGESAEGMDGIIASVLSSAVLGLVFGVFAAILCWITGKLVQRAKSD